MRIIVIDPDARVVDERDIAGGRRQIENIVGDRATFAIWLNGNVVYASEWPIAEPFFRLGDLGWISGAAVVAGAAAGEAGWHAPASIAVEHVQSMVNWSDPSDRPSAWLNMTWAAHLSDEQAFELMTKRKWDRFARRERP